MSSVYLPARLANAILVVADVASLPLAAESQEGDVRWVSSQASFYAFDGSAWTNESGIAGPGSTTDEALVRWDGTTGAAVQNSTVTLSDAGVMAGALIDADTNTITNIKDADIKSGAAIDAAKLHDGSVSNTEFGYINTLTSNAQTQLDAMVEKAGDTMTGLLTLSADPTTSLQASTKQYVDAKIDGVQRKTAVVVSTTGDITLSGEQTIDDVLTSASRVLVRFQSDQTENGIYESAAGAWSRTSDANTSAELHQAIVSVASGTLYSDKAYEQSTDDPDIGVDNIVWFQAYGAGTYVASETGLKLSGATFSIDLDGSTLTQSASGLKLVVPAAGVVSSDGTNLSSSALGTTAQYFRGDLSLSTFQTDVSANADVAANTAARHDAVTIGTGNGLSLSTQEISLAAATNSVTGALTSADWTTFNSKMSDLSDDATPKLGGDLDLDSNSVYEGANLLLHLTGTNNTFLGEMAGNLTITGSNNAAFGFNAGNCITSGFDNIFIGGSSGSLVEDGSSNTGVGKGTLNVLVDGSGNVAIGSNALSSNVSAAQNVAIGAGAALLSTGSNNTILGHSAMDGAVASATNVAIGLRAGDNLVGQGNNVIVGGVAGPTGDFKETVTLGRSATTGGNNSIAIGYFAVSDAANKMRIGNDSLTTIEVAPSTTIKGPDDVVADATAAEDLTVHASNKTAGTGSGGNLILSGGSSVGGTDGLIRLGGNLDTAAYGIGSNTLGQELNIVTADTTGSTHAGDITIFAGQNETGLGSGGDVNLFAGNGIGGGGTDGNIKLAGDIQFRQYFGGANRFVRVKVPTSSFTSYDLTLPDAQGAAGTVLENDSSGGLTWLSPHGKQYLNGVDFTLSTTGVTNPSFNRSVLIPYRTTDGAWRLKGNISLDHDADTNFNVVIPGVTFKNATSYFQAVLTREGDGRAFCNPSAGTISVAYGSGPVRTQLTLDVELDSKPSWAD